METILKLRNVSKVIGKKRIIHGISMNVKPGEIYGFLGPNGAGKTTTIRMLVGLIKPTSGTVEVCGHDIQKEREKALEHVGCIVENPELYSYMSGWKNLVHFGLLSKIPNLEYRIQEVTELVKLTDRIHDKVKTYSLGMRQRLGVAQAILSNPKLLILDEPTNGLDPAGMREFRNLIRQLADQGMAVFVSSHILAEIEQVADRIAIIQNGIIVAEQSMDKLLEQQEETIELVCEPVQEVVAFLRKQKLWFQNSEIGAFLVKVPMGKIPDLIRELVMRGIQITEVIRKKQSLEEEFLKLTGEKSMTMKGKKEYA
ncbi:ABC transporter ATP-binding protein [Risungbinella massiliensis]|uniref:ABC transporter ATP-binding protein n=1 Tax=Risungbinella massiliensis TaxID=1329796 RepID=UPI0005CC64DC|nr:ABC transporter ATP-binding protein [Risungbinella massiliensis]